AHVERRHMHRYLARQFFLEGLQAFAAAAGQNQCPAGFGETASGGATEARGGSGNEGDLAVHAVLSGCSAVSENGPVGNQRPGWERKPGTPVGRSTRAAGSVQLRSRKARPSRRSQPWPGELCRQMTVPSSLLCHR